MADVCYLLRDIANFISSDLCHVIGNKWNNRNLAIFNCTDICLLTISLILAWQQFKRWYFRLFHWYY